MILTIARVPAGSPGRVIVLSEFIRRLCGRDLTARDVNSLLHLAPLINLWAKLAGVRSDWFSPACITRCPEG